MLCHGVSHEGRVEQPVPDAAALDALMAAGDARKRKAATAMNERSTRAHTLLLFRLRQVWCVMVCVMVSSWCVTRSSSSRLRQVLRVM